ncbi:hypothetical protein TNCV_1229151 [Trichonephila clavipes]|nr:hypothetical protein TNCV_1229151 [Trichonephila clavipes]
MPTCPPSYVRHSVSGSQKIQMKGYNAHLRKNDTGPHQQSQRSGPHKKFENKKYILRYMRYGYNAHLGYNALPHTFEVKGRRNDTGPHQQTPHLRPSQMIRK